MDRVTALAVAAGVLMALMLKLAPIMSINSGICVIALGVYFGSGGRVPGLLKSLASLLTGMIWALLTNMLIASNLSLWSYRWVLFGIVAAILVLQSRVSMLSYLTGAFCGAAVTVAAGAASFRPDGILLGTAIIVGSLVGFVADAVAGLVAKKA